jgi:hypothetical protein
MIFTKKAAIGFILLAILTFSVATISYQNRVEMPKGNLVHVDGLVQPMVLPYKTNAPDTVMVYTNQGINAGEYTPLSMTVLIELFALVCYVGLKKIEPRVKAWEEKVKARHQDGGK